MKFLGGAMSNDNYLAESKNLCNEIGGAVLEVLGQKRDFTVQSLIDVLQEAENDNHSYGEEREKAMEMAIKLLQKLA